MTSQMTSGYFLNHHGFLLFITNVSIDKVIRFFQLRMINTPKENEGLNVIMKQSLDVANHKLFKTILHHQNSQLFTMHIYLQKDFFGLFVSLGLLLSNNTLKS